MSFLPSCVHALLTYPPSSFSSASIQRFNSKAGQRQEEDASFHTNREHHYRLLCCSFFFLVLETGEEFASGGLVELLECGDAGLVMEDAFLHPSSSFSSKKPARYLCYEDAGAGGEMGSCEPSRVVPTSVITGTDSSSTPSNCRGSSFSKTTIQKMGDGDDGSKAEQTPQRSSDRKVCKRPKTAAPLKVRKEKLGDRIAALQQLVSPYGKTDTASVLREAMGYIRFLHDQVQVLSSPYLQRLPSASSSPRWKEEGGEQRYNLRRRGLCLVPVESTMQVASSNGADMWSPAMAMGSSNSPSSNL